MWYRMKAMKVMGRRVGIGGRRRVGRSGGRKGAVTMRRKRMWPHRNSCRQRSDWWSSSSRSIGWNSRRMESWSDYSTRDIDRDCTYASY